MTSPAARIASENTSPLAPRSKRAVEIEERRARVRTASVAASADCVTAGTSPVGARRRHALDAAPENGKRPDGGSGRLNLEIPSVGDRCWDSLRAEHGGCSRVVLFVKVCTCSERIWQVELSDTSSSVFDDTLLAAWMSASSPPSSPSPTTARSRPPHGRSYTVQSNVSGHVAKLERELGVTPRRPGQRRAHRRGRTGRRTGPAGAPRDRRHLGRHRLARRRRLRRRPDRRDRHHRSVADAPAARSRRATGIHGCTRSSARAARPRSCPGVLSGQLNAAIIHLPIDDPELDRRAAVRRRPPPARPQLSSARRTRHDVAAASSRTCRCCSRRRAPRSAVCSTGPPAASTSRCGRRPRSTASACSHRSRSTGTAPRSCRPPPRRSRSRATSKRVLVPELPRRVVAWVRRRRPGPSAATSAVAAILSRGRPRPTPTSSPASISPPTTVPAAIRNA